MHRGLELMIEATFLDYWALEYHTLNTFFLKGTLVK